jgi:hypothetical protein
MQGMEEVSGSLMVGGDGNAGSANQIDLNQTIKTHATVGVEHSRPAGIFSSGKSRFYKWKKKCTRLQHA